MNPGILINPEVLSQSYIPEKILHREREFTELSKTLGFADSFVMAKQGLVKLSWQRKSSITSTRLKEELFT